MSAMTKPVAPSAPVGDICPACHGCGFDNPAIATSPCRICNGSGHAAPVGDDAAFLNRAKVLLTSIVYRTNGATGAVEKAVGAECLRFLHDLDAAHTLPAAAPVGDDVGPWEPRGCPTPGACSAAARIAELERAYADEHSIYMKIINVRDSDLDDTTEKLAAALRKLAGAQACIAAADVMRECYLDSWFGDGGDGTPPTVTAYDAARAAQGAARPGA